MAIAKLRSGTKGIFSLMAKPLVSLGLSPNSVSLLGLIFAIAASFLIYKQNYFVAAILVSLAGIMDALDGAVARLSNKQTGFGNYFETMVDKFVVIALFLPFAFLYPLLAYLAITFSFMSSYAKARAALVIITDNRDWPAIGEHGDRLLILIAGLLIAPVFPEIAGFSTIETMLALVFLTAFIGTLQRMFYAKKLIAEAEKTNKLLPYLKEKKDSRYS